MIRSSDYIIQNVINWMHKSAKAEKARENGVVVLL